MNADDMDRKRTVSQNSKMWPMLTDISKQVPWAHTVRGRWQIGSMPPKGWKAVLTAAFEKELEMAEGWDGGQVMVGVSTSNFGVRKFAEFIEYIYSCGSAKDVQWSDKSEQIRRDYGSGK